VTPERRAEGLAAAARTLRAELLEHAETQARARAVDVLRSPAPGSVMLELDSPVGRFCFTEVVVTSAEVRVEDREGWGCVLGYDEEGALAAAILDASAGADVERLAGRALDAESRQADEEARAVGQTRVDASRAAESHHG
jgi:alpha-D-ribose 1-methylphosphonate 5-triphosphate synthase subunit PhnG